MHDITPEQAILTGRILFWILCAGIFFLPMRWAFYCFIVAAHLDITTSEFTSAAAIGFENTVRISLLPLALLARMRFTPIKNLQWTWAHKIWIALVAYAGIAALWSDFRLSALKMVVYLTAYFVIYAIFLEAWKVGWLDVKLITYATWSVIVLAFVQTYLLGDYSGTEDRLTSFSTAQYFAAYLIAALAILIFSDEKGPFYYVTCAAILVAIMLSGSRYVFISTIFLFLIASFRTAAKHGITQRLKVHSGRIIFVVCAIVLIAAILTAYFPSSRIDELLSTMFTPNLSVEDVGTFAWRLGIYFEIFNQLQNRNLRQLLVGSGTSSGAGLMYEYDPSRYAETGEEGVDGNRVLHSEFLRALYEWGIIGLMLLCSFLIVTIAATIKRAIAQGGGPALALLGIFPSILFGLAIENILAGAASAAGVGILLAMTFAWSSPSFEPVSIIGNQNVNTSTISWSY